MGESGVQPGREGHPSLRATRRATLVAGTPVALLAFAAVLQEARLPALVVLIGGLVALRGDAVGRWAWAAPIGAAISLAWGLQTAPAAAPDGSDCASPFAPPATWRLAEAVLVVATLVVISRWLPSHAADLGLRRPSDRVFGMAVAAGILAGPVAVHMGPVIAAPFFGQIAFRADRLGAVVPALVFAVSNGTMEELVYRGAFQGWLGHALRTIGGPSGAVFVAIVAQALVFGLAHGVGLEYVGSPAPVVAAMVAGGLLAGAIVQRTGSLALPIALHIALDVPLYYYWACRVA